MPAGARARGARGRRRERRSAPSRPASGDPGGGGGPGGQDRRHPGGGGAARKGAPGGGEKSGDGTLRSAGLAEGPAPARDGADGDRVEDRQVPVAAPRGEDQQGIPGGAQGDRDLPRRAGRLRREDPAGDGGGGGARQGPARPGGGARPEAPRHRRGEDPPGRAAPAAASRDRNPRGGAPGRRGDHRAGLSRFLPEGGEAASRSGPGGGARRTVRRLPRARHAEADPAGPPGHRPHLMRFLQALPVRRRGLRQGRAGAGRSARAVKRRSPPAKRPPAGGAPAGPALVAHIDGGARGNPGPAGYGAHVVEEGSGRVIEIFGYLGVATNNVAEYAALLAVLEYATVAGAASLRIFSD